MNETLAMNRWNKKFRPGQAVIVEKHERHAGKTLTRALTIWWRLNYGALFFWVAYVAVIVWAVWKFIRWFQ